MRLQRFGSMKLQRFAEPGAGDGGNNGSGAAGGQPDPNKGDPQTFSAEYVKQLRDEAASHRVKAKEFEDQLTALKAQSTEFPNKLLKALGLEPDPNKNWEKQVEDAKATAQAATTKANQKLVKAEVKVIAKDLNIVDSDAAFALADLSKVQVTDDGTVTGVKEALEALLTAKPYLKASGDGKPAGSGGSAGGGARGGGSGSKTPEEAAKELAEARNKGDQPKEGAFDPWKRS